MSDTPHAKTPNTSHSRFTIISSPPETNDNDLTPGSRYLAAAKRAKAREHALSSSISTDSATATQGSTRTTESSEGGTFEQSPTRKRTISTFEDDDIIETCRVRPRTAAQTMEIVTRGLNLSEESLAALDTWNTVSVASRTVI
jgi:hypothetical protein